MSQRMQQFSQKRLQELEKQAQEYTDEDLLNEADELEKEMLAGNISYDLPEDFFQQILAKGKLIEAERRMHSDDTVGETELCITLKPISTETCNDSAENQPQSKPKWWQFWKRK